MSRHQSRRRRLYGRRLHELRERRDRSMVDDAGADAVSAHAGRVAIPIVTDAHAAEPGIGLGLAAVVLD